MAWRNFSKIEVVVLNHAAGLARVWLSFAGAGGLHGCCWVPECSGLRRRVCPTFPAGIFFSEPETIRDKVSSPSRVFQVATTPLRSGTISSSCFWRRPAAAGCFCLPVALSVWRDATNGLKQKRVARANGLSPGHGRPVQLRFETELTAEESVSREAWKNATFPPCLQGRSECDCGLMRHGTYGRKTPVPMRVAVLVHRQRPATVLKSGKLNAVRSAA